MKTKNLFISGLIGLFASCSSQNCKIEGTVENAKDGDTLYLARMSDGNFTPTDTIILHQGKFTLQEKCDSTIIASFFFYDQESNEVCREQKTTTSTKKLQIPFMPFTSG